MLSCNSRPRQVLVINVGDELLDGIRENTHLLWLGEHLARRGLPVTRSLVVRDDAAEIARAVGEAWAPTTSSSPPAASGRPPTTHTREAVAGALGLKLEHVPAAEKALRERFKLIGRKVAAGDLGQRHVLAGGDALPNPRGTAPGVFYHRDGKALVMLPGPALELRPMFEDEVVPRLRDVGRACQGEVSAVAAPSASAPCPSRRSSARRSSPAWCFPSARIPAVVDARISSGGSGATADELCEVARQVRDAVGEDFVATGHACPPRSSSSSSAASRRPWPSPSPAPAASSPIRSPISPVPPRSLLGSAVCYANDAKVNLLGIPECLSPSTAPFSAECAAAMATGAIEKFGSDYAISVTGYAGPGGGTEADPVGTVYFGYASPTGVWSRRVAIPGDRRQVKQRAVNTALDFMRRKLNKYRVEDLLHGREGGRQCRWARTEVCG
jgi:nicotinamide-nucleotide amidase